MSIIYPGFLGRSLGVLSKSAKLPVSKDIFIRVGLIITPMLIGIIGVKSYKLIFALWPVTRSTLGWESPTLFGAIRIVLLSPVGFLIFAYLTIYLFLWRRFSIKHWFHEVLLFLLPVIFLPIVKIIWATIKGNLVEFEFSLIHGVRNVYVNTLSDIQFLIGIYRADIFFLMGYGLIFTFIFSFVSSQWRRRVFIFAICLNTLILTFAGLELIHYLRTGMNGNVAMLKYLFTNARDLWYMVEDEIHWKISLAMLLPFALTFLFPLIVDLITTTHPCLKWRRDKRVVNMGKMIWLCLFAAALIPEHVNLEYARLRGNIILNFGKELLFQPDIPLEAVKEGEALRHAALNLELVPVARSPHKNIVIILLESVRADATSIYNPNLENTPFLLDLSKKSLVATSMYAVVPRTAAAWVSVLNGLYPSTNSALMYWAYQEADHPKFASLPRFLRKAGYKSAFFVPTHLDYENEGQLLYNMGFDRIVSKKDYGSPSYENVNSFGFEDKVMIEPILSWVDAQREDHSPFFLTIMTNVGHEKYDLPSTWNRRNFAFNEDEDYNNYLNCIAYIDDFLKKTLYEFQRRGLFQDTIFFILGDHGDSFGEHGTRERALTLYEEALHIPLIIFAPSLVRDGREIVGPRQQIDIFPTIADMLGFSLHGDPLPGVSLLGDNPRDRELYYGSILEGVAIGMRLNSRKYIYKFDSGQMEVFDLDKDPGEQHDLAAEISQTEAWKAKNQMLKWYGATRVAMTSSEPAQPDVEQPLAADGTPGIRKAVLSIPENDKEAQ
jgi:lipoteichoic acid synthase